MHSIAAASGWFAIKGGLKIETVACFALVSALDKDNGLLIARQVIPLTQYDLGLELVGSEIDAKRKIQHDQDPRA